MKLTANAVGSLITLVIILCVAGVTMAQEKQSPIPTTSPAAPAGNPADVASMDSIIAAVYDVISGPAGKKRDWDRMRSLFEKYLKN